MGMTTHKKSGGLNSEINVTPLADVMLVLLIIVMLIAPLLQKGVNVELPLAANTSGEAGGTMRRRCCTWTTPGDSSLTPCRPNRTTCCRRFSARWTGSSSGSC